MWLISEVWWYLNERSPPKFHAWLNDRTLLWVYVTWIIDGLAKLSMSTCTLLMLYGQYVNHCFLCQGLIYSTDPLMWGKSCWLVTQDKDSGWHVMAPWLRNTFHIAGFCEGNPLVTGEFPSQRTGMWSFVVSIVCSISKLCKKRSGLQWFET